MSDICPFGAWPRDTLSATAFSAETEHRISKPGRLKVKTSLRFQGAGKGGFRGRPGYRNRGKPRKTRVSRGLSPPVLQDFRHDLGEFVSRMGAFLGYAGMDVGKEHKKIVVEFRRIHCEQARRQSAMRYSRAYKTQKLSPTQ